MANLACKGISSPWPGHRSAKLVGQVLHVAVSSPTTCPDPIRSRPARYAESIAERGAAALALELGRTFTRPPIALVEACARSGLTGHSSGPDVALH
jgi:hypothetical protein